MAFDYAGAQAAGYSPEEIQGYLSTGQEPNSGQQPSSPMGQSGPQANPQWSDLPGNILPSAGKFVGGALSAITHPVQTVKTLASIPIGAGEKLARGVDQNILGNNDSNLPEMGGEKTVDNLVNMIKGRYGSLDNIKKTVITDPVGFAADLSTLIDGAGAVTDAAGITGKAAEIGDVASIPRVADEAKAAGAVDETVGRMARNVVQPQTAGDSIGSLSKQENIAKNTLDVTKGASKYGIAKSIEKVEDLVNTAKSKLISELDKNNAPMPLGSITKEGENAGTLAEQGGNAANAATAETAAPTVGDKVINALKNDSAAKTNPDMFTRLKEDLQSRLEGHQVTAPDGTTGIPLSGIDQVGRDINATLREWAKRGSPAVTEADQYNVLLEKAKQSLDGILAEKDPRVKELINTQANLIPSYKGLFKGLGGESKLGGVRGAVSGAIKGVNSLVDPIQTILARDPNSEFAQRLQQLVPELQLGKGPVGTATSAILKGNVLNKTNQIKP